VDADDATNLESRLAEPAPNEEVVLLIGGAAPPLPPGGLRFEVIDAAPPRTVIEAVNRLEPVVVHFPDHRELFFRGPRGERHRFGMRDLGVLFSMARRAVRVTVFDGPLTREQAEFLTVPIAIGDAAAEGFAPRFYAALGAGVPVAGSFDRARAGIAGVRPQLFARPGIQPKAMVLVTAGR
jgi:hypothetical protein